MTDEPYALGLFAAVGIELELMIVDAASLDVRPIADELIRAECGHYESEIERGDVAWSNELALHLIELKTNGPRAAWAGLGAAFHRDVQAMNAHLAALGARLLPTSMHPWMDPARETRLWPHEYAEVYELFDSIFDCRSHGWANVQSVHVNLPFRDDAEFSRLHAAIRFLLPILPALAASSPLRDGRVTGALDSRLEAYRHHTDVVPQLVGAVIPEPVYRRAAYERLLEGLYAAMAPHDPAGVLRHEWVNARGAIARFDRGAIEIRLLDTQENVFADVAVARAVSAAVELLVEQPFAAIDDLGTWPTERLAALLAAVGREAEQTILGDREYLAAFDLRAAGRHTAGELWSHLWQQIRPRIGDDTALTDPVEHILRHGTLATRILGACDANRADPDRAGLRVVYRELAECLAQGRMFGGSAA